MSATPKAKAALFCCFILVMWMAIVAMLNIMVSGDPTIGISVVYYIFNLLIFACIVLLGSGQPAWFSVLVSRASFWAMVTTVILLAATYVPSAARQSGSFNNPNQLAYFSLLLAGMFVLVTPADKIWSVRGGVFLGLCILAISFAASLSVMLAIILVVIAAFLKSGRARSLFRMSVFILSFAAVGTVFVSSTGLGASLSESVGTRLAAFERKTADVSATRGYSRIGEYPKYIVFGAGEGGRWRFGPQHQLEIHSVWGTLLFSYGVPGLLVFSALLIVLLRGQPVWVVFIVVAPCVYGLTHQGLRTTAFWILLACVSWTQQHYGRQDAAREGRV